MEWFAGFVSLGGRDVPTWCFIHSINYSVVKTKVELKYLFEEHVTGK